MIFYKRMIGDIQAKTGHLTLSEFGAYDRLLDHYYSTEKGLPADFERCCGIARAVNKDDRKAVEFVLAEFFTLGSDNLYRQGKTEEMIADAQPKIAAARTNGRLGGRPKKPKPETQQKPSGLLNENPTGTQRETQTEPNSKASQSQSQSIGIPTDVAKDKNSVCVEPHTHFSDEFRTAAKARPDVDADAVWTKFNDHYPPEKRTLARWKTWLSIERGPAQNGHGSPSVSDPMNDPNSKASIEAMGVAKGLGKWDGLKEQFVTYKARVLGSGVEA